DARGNAERSLYARVFLEPAVANPPDPALAISAVTMPPATVTEIISNHVPAVLAGLMITEQDLTDLMPLTEKVTLANLSSLYRTVILSRSLGLAPADLIRFVNRAGISDPFASIQQTQSMFDLWHDVSK